MSRLTHLSDRKLHSSTKKARQAEHAAMFDVLAHLNEIDRRRSYRAMGYSSIFRYCTEELGYSSSAAGRRIQAARCIRRFPQIGRLLRRHEVNLTTIDKVAGILNEETKDKLIQQIRHKSEREVQDIIDRYRPPVELRDRVRSVGVRVSVKEGQGAGGSPSLTAAPGAGGLCEKSHYSRNGSVCSSTLLVDRSNHDSTSGASHSPISVTDSAPGTRIERRIHIQFLAQPDFMSKYQDARAVLSHAHPNASFATVFDAVLDYFLDRECPKRRDRRRVQRKANSRPARQATSEMSRHIPAAVRDRVYERDGGRCTFVGTSGKRCTATENLQIDHIVPFARGGTSNVSNLRVLCRTHNQLAAEQAFGREHMNRFQ
jgi:5-methylcytosine-specific restriction endonuclease McrA